MARMAAKSQARTPSLRAAVAAVVLALVWLAMLTVGTGGVDDDILGALYAGERPAVAAIASFFTFLGEASVGIPVSIAGIALLAWLGRRQAAVSALLVILVGRLLVTAQKYGIDRLRPQDEPHLAAATSPAFPSGHAANSMIVCLAFALLFFGKTRWRHAAVAVALVLTFLIGSSRVVLGVHWPSDVIGGWAFGLLWVMLALPLAERLVR